ncbi:MAG: hypothetical protein ACREKE_07435, partial [bacterium]
MAGMALRRLAGPLVGMVLLAACAAVHVPFAKLTPDGATLKEHALDPAERGAYTQVSGSAGVDGAEALYYLGLDKAAAGDWDSAAALWRGDVIAHRGSGWDRLATYQVARFLERQSQGEQAFLWYQSLLTGTAVDGLPGLSQAACLRLIQGMNEADTRALLAGRAGPQFTAPLRIRLLWLALAAGRMEEVQRGMDKYLL